MEDFSILDALTYTTFQEHLNDKFMIRADFPEPLEVELVEVSESSQRMPLRQQEQFESFSLIFHSPLNFLLEQGTYLFAHEQLGELPIFITPIKQTADGFRYQAVFNRLRR